LRDGIHLNNARCDVPLTARALFFKTHQKAGAFF